VVEREAQTKKNPFMGGMDVFWNNTVFL